MKKALSTRSLNLFNAAMISSGAMIGSGIFMQKGTVLFFLKLGKRGRSSFS